MPIPEAICHAKERSLQKAGMHLGPFTVTELRQAKCFFVSKKHVCFLRASTPVHQLSNAQSEFINVGVTGSCDAAKFC